MTLLTGVAPARGDEPPAWLRARDPDWAHAQDVRGIGIVMTGAGTALMIGFAGVVLGRLASVLALHECDSRPDGSNTCDVWQPSDRPAEIGLAAAGVAALGLGVPLILVGDQRLGRWQAKHHAELRATASSVGVRVRF